MNSDDPDDACPEVVQSQLDLVTFWLDGIIQTVLASFGVTCNCLFSLILMRKELRNSFNILLIILALFDTTYLVAAILESARKNNLASELHLRLFPHLLYPMQAIALTGSIFMTVAISLERYIAVHNPINYNRAMNDPKATKSRVMKFLIPVTLLSGLFSVPKFLEAQIHHTESGILVGPTAMRLSPTYIRCRQWAQLLVQGIIPMLLLIFFNKRIFNDIKERQRRWRPYGQNFRDCSNLSTRPTSSHLSVPSPRSPSASHSPMSPIDGSSSILDRNSRRRFHEDNMAKLFMILVAMFVVCNLPRLFLNCYETIVLEKAIECQASNKNPVPQWIYVMTSFSHFFLTLNSSSNLLVYCLSNTQFRTVAKASFITVCWPCSALWTKSRNCFARKNNTKDISDPAIEITVLPDGSMSPFVLQNGGETASLMIQRVSPPEELELSDLLPRDSGENKFKTLDVDVCNSTHEIFQITEACAQIKTTSPTSKNSSSTLTVPPSITSKSLRKSMFRETTI